MRLLTNFFQFLFSFLVRDQAVGADPSAGKTGGHADTGSFEGSAGTAGNYGISRGTGEEETGGQGPITEPLKLTRSRLKKLSAALLFYYS